MIKSDNEKVSDADIIKGDQEYLRNEQDYERKQRQREYMKEKERLQNERFERLEEKVDRLVDYIGSIASAEKEKQRKEREEYYNSFEYQAKMAHEERMREEERKRHDVKYQADLHYSLFCAWCNAFHPEIIPGTGDIHKGKIDYKKMQETSYINTEFFKEYMEVERESNLRRGKDTIFNSKVSDDVLKRVIAETYFGFEYYKDENGLLKARKKKKETDTKTK